MSLLESGLLCRQSMNPLRCCSFSLCCILLLQFVNAPPTTRTCSTHHTNMLFFVCVHVCVCVLYTVIVYQCSTHHTNFLHPPHEHAPRTCSTHHTIMLFFVCVRVCVVYSYSLSMPHPMLHLPHEHVGERQVQCGALGRPTRG